MARRTAGSVASPRIVRLGMVMAGALLSASAAEAQAGGEAPTAVRVHGTVFDSLTRTPLAGARVAFVPAATLGSAPLATTTGANGTFEIALVSGRWLAAVEHPRFDSLGVDIPAQPVEVPRTPQFALALATPSPGTLTRAFCGPQPHASDVALVGMVRAAASGSALDSAEVLVQWVDPTLGRRGFTRTVDTRTARSDRNGWYVLCGVPAGGEVLVWAEHGSATTGAIAITLPQAPARLDLVLDTTTRVVVPSSDAPSDSAGVKAGDARRPPTLGGRSRYRAVVRDVSGRPLPNARARTLGHRYAVTDDHGSVVLDSLPAGSQTLEVLALGYLPERRVVEVRADNARADTVVLTSLASVLDTIRVTAGRDATGFEARRKGKTGQFITAADILRENPMNTSSLLRTRDGVRVAYDRRGNAFMESSVAGGKGCRPLILIDGFRQAPVPSAKGIPDVNWAVHPEEIGGVEIYTNPAQVPPKFAIWGSPCGAIVFWTREKLGIAKAPRTGPP